LRYCEHHHASTEAGTGHPYPEHSWSGPKVSDEVIELRGSGLEPVGKTAVALVHEEPGPDQIVLPQGRGKGTHT